MVHIIKDLKLGRLPNDSVTLRKDSVLTDEFFQQQFLALQQTGSLHGILSNLEPRHNGYLQLKAGIKHFLDNASFREFTRVPSLKDTGFKTALQKRLFEEGFIAYDSVRADSATLAGAIKKFQKKAGINVDGKAGEVTVRMLNTNDEDRFVRIAITLDRYKLLPEKMPGRYLWVNLPGYYLQLVENDTVKLYSKIICGKPHTRSPVLNASVSELITYPQWTIPQSIIVKEILPVLKKNPGYLEKKGYSLLNNKSEEVDPYLVDWSKYSKGIPYRIIQGSGDANALGVMKFNFSNKYAIYLHDTNQRSLFSNDDRAMSHGCIRVQNWEALALDILRSDNPGSRSKEDSVIKWLKYKEKHTVSVRNRLPLFIRYFTCEGKNGEIVFYDDIYGEDKMLREKYFTGK
jgi:murein L,D-transpeptidase YcbB/YkuD